MRLGMREGYQLYVRAIGQDLFHALGQIAFRRCSWWDRLMGDLTTSELAVSPPACVPPAITLMGRLMSQSAMDWYARRSLRLISGVY